MWAPGASEVLADSLSTETGSQTEARRPADLQRSSGVFQGVPVHISL